MLESERLGGGHSALQLQDCDLAAMVEGGEGIRIDIEPELPALRLDPMRIQLLLRNLIDNAKRHNDASRGPVIVNLKREGQVLRLSVRDHGPGVPEAALEHLGEPFYRPDAARTRVDGGVGPRPQSLQDDRGRTWRPPGDPQRQSRIGSGADLAGCNEQAGRSKAPLHEQVLAGVFAAEHH